MSPHLGALPGPLAAPDHHRGGHLRAARGRRRRCSRWRGWPGVVVGQHPRPGRDLPRAGRAGEGGRGRPRRPAPTSAWPTRCATRATRLVRARGRGLPGRARHPHRPGAADRPRPGAADLVAGARAGDHARGPRRRSTASAAAASWCSGTGWPVFGVAVLTLLILLAFSLALGHRAHAARRRRARLPARPRSATAWRPPSRRWRGRSPTSGCATSRRRRRAPPVVADRRRRWPGARARLARLAGRARRAPATATAARGGSAAVQGGAAPRPPSRSPRRPAPSATAPSPAQPADPKTYAAPPPPDHRPVDALHGDDRDVLRRHRRSPSTPRRAPDRRQQLRLPRPPGLLRRAHLPPRRAPASSSRAATPRAPAAAAPATPSTTSCRTTATRPARSPWPTPAPDTNGSQFFIVTGDASSLPNDYTRFGRVTRGLDVARTIESFADPAADPARPVQPGARPRRSSSTGSRSPSHEPGGAAEPVRAGVPIGQPRIGQLAFRSVMPIGQRAARQLARRRSARRRPAGLLGPVALDDGGPVPVEELGGDQEAPVVAAGALLVAGRDGLGHVDDEDQDAVARVVGPAVGDPDARRAAVEASRKPDSRIARAPS